MGLFSNLKTDVKIGLRNDDNDGKYLQRIDRVEIATSQNNQEYLKIYKTVIHVLDSKDGKAHPVGAQTTHAMFPDKNPKYDYFDKELRAFVKAAANLTTEEINAMSNDMLTGLLTKDAKKLEGVVLESHAWRQPNASNPGKSYQKVRYERRVEPAEVQKTISPERFREFFPGAK